MKSSIYRFCFLKAISFGKIHAVNYFVSDIRNQGIIIHKDRKWLEYEILPTIIDKGVNKIAIITQNNLFNNYYVNILKQNKNIHKIPIGYFENIETALDWLLSTK